MKKMMKGKKAQEGASSGWGTITNWLVIIGLGIVLMYFLFISSGVGQGIWQKIKDLVPFI